ncbi:loquacious isoform b [Holotrichia oblita]|uniref:Loquacious isoform b n=2 Tax=Holotrichia oblita TaxID=644536 RepID=A0ACB9T2V4_HOLOL|nr:loquacious isoform b [Holotrichia oblita]KAI4461150.1 loquacious isoform b [Holotrichia oblita]
MHVRRSHKRVTVHSMLTEQMTLGDAAKLEMASLPTKTPVSVLQELLSRRGITPKYELVQIEGAIHEPIFRYRVFLSNEYIATGTGRSKKEAKHAAAKNLLDLLVGKTTAEQANPTNGTTSLTDITNQVVSPFDDKVMGNPIGWLQEMCMSRRWPPPSYEMENEEGLPHERQFTIACKVLKFREIGTGKSKKLAKRMAAHKMWQALQDMSLENTNINQMFDEDEELTTRGGNLQSRYAGLKDSKINTIASNNSHSHKVSQFHKYLKQANGPKVTELQNTSVSIKDFNCIQFLQELATELQFETTYVDIDEKSVTGKYQCLLQISTVPLAVCFGTGNSPKDAQMSAAFNALEYLKIATRK